MLGCTTKRQGEGFSDVDGGGLTVPLALPFEDIVIFGTVPFVEWYGRREGKSVRRLRDKENCVGQDYSQRGWIEMLEFTL